MKNAKNCLRKFQRKGFKNMSIAFTNDKITDFSGGLYLNNFLCGLKFDDLVDEYINVPYAGKKYTKHDMIKQLNFLYASDYSRIEHIPYLNSNPLINNLLDLENLPCSQTSRNFMSKMIPESIDNLNIALFKQVSPPHNYIKPVTMVIDSSASRAYGHQENVVAGRLSDGRKKPAYQWALAAIAQTKDILFAEEYPGNTNFNPKFEEILNTALKRIPPGYKASRLRIDCGFFSWNNCKLAASHGLEYAVKMGKYPNIVEIINNIPDDEYENVPGYPYVQVAETTYNGGRAKFTYRLIIKREKLADRKPTQMKLFDITNYDYQVIVTNMTLKPANVWKFYNKSNIIESIIQECKESFAVTRIDSSSFTFNRAMFKLKILFYNIANLFRRCILGNIWLRKKIKSIKRLLWHIPAKIMARGRGWVLCINRRHPQSEFLTVIQKRILKFCYDSY